MFLNLFKNIMTKNTKVDGISAKDMNLKELQELAISVGINFEPTTKRKELLAEVKKWEDKAVADADKKAGVVATPKTTLNAPDLGEHEGKKVTKRTPITINEREYIDILVESGETYREEVK
jgi:hypothetical protein